MPSRRSLAALCCAAALAIAGCGGGGDGYGCTGTTCTLSFDGPGTQDLSSNLGKGVTVEVVDVGGTSATVRIAGKEAELEESTPQQLGKYEVTFAGADGDKATLRVVAQ